MKLSRQSERNDSEYCCLLAARSPIRGATNDRMTPTCRTCRHFQVYIHVLYASASELGCESCASASAVTGQVAAELYTMPHCRDNVFAILLRLLTIATELHCVTCYSIAAGTILTALLAICCY
jgi:hypothetical protein